MPASELTLDGPVTESENVNEKSANRRSASESTTREVAMRPFDRQQVKFERRAIGRGQEQVVACHFDVTGMGKTEDEALASVEQNWKVRKEFEATWEERQKSSERRRSFPPTGRGE